ncbi:MAG: hypothetical protein P4M00_19090 [Azospirillaceae bacterium]|nr:hypothetical protein [Azospirillaceae bacterium]
MTSATPWTSKTRWAFGPAALALVIATLAIGLPTAPAQAQDYYHHERRAPPHYEHHRHPYQPEPYYGPPAYAYPPPPVYYAPPPGPPVIDFVFPLRLR